MVTLPSFLALPLPFFPLDYLCVSHIILTIVHFSFIYTAWDLGMRFFFSRLLYSVSNIEV